MKKGFVLIGMLILYCVNISFGGEVPVSKAKQVAINYYNHWSDYQKTAKVTETMEIKENDEIVFYVFNFSTGGYMIISGDDEVRPVLSYSFKGRFIKNDPNMPPNYASFLNNYKQQILEVKKMQLKGDNSVKEMWNNYYSGTFKSAKGTKDVSPLLDIESIAWGQGCYYNADCPEDPDGSCGHVVTGCVATAMAQIMRYHSWPDQGTGYHSYTHNNYGFQSADFGSSSYDWASMPGSVTSNNAEVTEIMYHCGVAVEMNYGPDGSGANSEYARDGFVDYFNYESGASYENKTDYTDDNWKDMIISDIDNGWPVYYAGCNPNPDDGGCHAFVCDGYQATDEFHFNWGWNGYYNSYNTLDNLIPDGSSSNYSSVQRAIFNVHPNADPFTVVNPTSWAADSIEIGASTTSGTITLTNNGLGTLTVNSATDLSATPFSTTFVSGDVSLNAGENYTFTFDFNPTTAGTYNETFTIETNGGTVEVELSGAGQEPCSIIDSYPFEEGFETAVPPACWTSLDEDGDGFNWTRVPNDTQPAHSGDFCTMSASWNIYGALTPDNYLITPALDVNANLCLSFWVAAVDPEWPAEYYSVMVSTTGTSPADFTEIYSETLSTDTWTEVTLPLTDYHGETIYIAIRHWDVTDMFQMLIDDFEIDAAVGENMNATESIAVFPNPADNMIYVENAENAQINVMNMVGQVVASKLADSNRVSISIADLAEGTYIIRIENGNEVSTQKLNVIR